MKDKDREMAKAINAEFSDDDEKDEDVESNWDEDEKPHDDEDASTEKKAKEPKRKKEKQDNQNVEDEDEKEEDGKDDGEDEKPEDDEDVEAEDGDNEKGDRAEASDELPSRRDGRRFIKLSCPHCAHRSVTFKEYSLHLYSSRHNTAMRRIAARHKATLARMRVVQRQEQRRVEVKDASRGTLPSRTMFCPICKLNYRSLKAMHHLSESHRQMKRFLTPFCRVCRIQFRSPMLYETHICSLDHIKVPMDNIRKSLVDDRLTTGNGDAEADSSGAEEEDKEVNLNNFMTLDSVGDVDAEEEDETATAAIGEKKNKDKAEPVEAPPVEVEKKPKNKQMIKVGSEYIKRVEVQFCELCKVYLPRNENSERAIALHCSTRSHLKRYVRDNDNKTLSRQSQRIHLQISPTSTTTNSTTNATNSTENVKLEVSNSEQSNANNDSGDSSATAAVNNTSNTNEAEESNETPAEPDANVSAEAEEELKTTKETAGDEEDEDEYRGEIGDKLWDDVDKDLGDILREAEPGMKSSDDEDSRYDRFRNSEKAASQLKKDEAQEENEVKEEATNVLPKKTEDKDESAE